MSYIYFTAMNKLILMVIINIDYRKNKKKKEKVEQYHIVDMLRIHIFQSDIYG